MSEGVFLGGGGASTGDRPISRNDSEDFVNAAIVQLAAVLNARFDAMDKALPLAVENMKTAAGIQSNELARRLDILNHAYDRADKVQLEYVRREVQDKKDEAVAQTFIEIRKALADMNLLNLPRIEAKSYFDAANLRMEVMQGALTTLAQTLVAMRAQNDGSASGLSDAQEEADRADASADRKRNYFFAIIAAVTAVLGLYFATHQSSGGGTPTPATTPTTAAPQVVPSSTTTTGVK